ncbi:MAG: hypothetical protein GXY86_09920 [Firmicutes bacterium]|nr:hypothetical protein [Bacillota bacterium]
MRYRSCAKICLLIALLCFVTLPVVAEPSKSETKPVSFFAKIKQDISFAFKSIGQFFKGLANRGAKETKNSKQNIKKDFKDAKGKVVNDTKKTKETIKKDFKNTKGKVVKDTKKANRSVKKSLRGTGTKVKKDAKSIKEKFKKGFKSLKK